MRRIVVLFGILLALASLIPQSTTAQEASLVPARIRVMHASPDIGLVDMFVQVPLAILGMHIDHAPVPDHRMHTRITNSTQA